MNAFITLKCNNVNQHFKFLIDTGADISICKKKTLGNIHTNETATLTGITSEAIQCLGTKRLNLDISDEEVEHTFHIVEDNFPIAADGIIGRDMLTKHMCKIDFETFTIIFNVNERDITLPMNSKPIYQTRITIPARSEAIVPLNIKVQEDSIVLNMEIKKGVYLGNSIIPARGVAHVRLLNTRDNEETLEYLNCKVRPLKHYDVYKTCLLYTSPSPRD